MDGQDVLRGNRHAQQQCDQQPLQRAAAVGFLPAHQHQGLVGQGVGQAGAGDGHGEGAQQRVGQRHRGATAQALVEGRQRAFDSQATHQAARQRTDDQRHHHMHPAQAEDQHYPHRRHYRIHRLSSAFQALPAAAAPRKKARTLPKAGAPVKSVRNIGRTVHNSCLQIAPSCIPHGYSSPARQEIAGRADNE
ncbi:hypothetical protein FQZ97_659380 [compost metagenome]